MCVSRASPFPTFNPSHVLRVVLQTLDEICDRVSVEADLVNSGEKRKPGDETKQTMEMIKEELFFFALESW